VTGYRSSRFRWDCKAKGCYYQQLPDWDDLLPCFPRGIAPTDVDGLVEIGSNLLFMEQKGPGVPIPDAQRLALQRASRREGVTTLFFRPPLRVASDLECLIFGNGPPDGWQPCSRDQLKDWLRAWAIEADAHPIEWAA
jgi:hypothetical protein